MSEDTRKIVLPAYLMRRFEAFRIVKNGEQSYLLRDKLQGKTHDFDAWQFFILEILPASDSFERLQTSFQDRFDRALTRAELDEFLGSVADRKLWDESAATHPLLKPFVVKTYTVEDGKAVPKPFANTGTGESVPAAPVPAPAPAPAQAKAEAPPADDAVLPAGVQDALGLDWRTAKKFLPLFDPRPALRLLAPVLNPLRHLVYAVPLLALAAVMLIYTYFPLVTEDLHKLHIDITLFEHLLFLFVTVHVFTTVTAGLVAQHYQVAVEKVGVTLAFGFMPRWVLKMNGAERMTRHQVMWLHGSLLLVRVLLFSIGTLVWFNNRDTGGALPQFGLLMMFACAAGLLLESGNPLVKANGYYFLSAFLNEPHLRGKAYAALLNKMRGGVYRAADNTLLAIYGLLSATYVLLIILVVAIMLAKWVLGDLQMGGSAILITLGFVGLLLWRNYAGLKQFADTFDRQVQFDRWRTRTLNVDVEAGEVKTAKPAFWKRAVLVALLVALFLPYPYEPGGAFVVHPSRKQVIATDEPGLVEAVFFDGGETIKAGTVIARLANQDTNAQIKVLTAKIDEQQAVINNLKTLPRPEEVKLAMQLLEVERARESFSREKAPRLEKMYKAGAVSFEEYDTARKEHATDLQQVAQREAELALVKAPVTTSEIAAAEAKLAGLIEERASYQGKVQRTTLTMPFDGNLLTLHLKDKVNSFLEKGATFATIENTGTVTAEIDVPEADVQYIQLGAPVRVRPVSFSDDDEFVGKVTVIDRNVTVKPTGNVVKVLATIDNKDGLLKTGMAGRAKVDGVNMPVWKAFTLGIVRFIQVQVWSWIP